MTTYTIPCETFARLARLLDATDSNDPWVNSIRLESNLAIVTSRTMLAVERLPVTNDDAPIHIVTSPDLVTACAGEASFNGSLEVVVNDALRWASAKTTFGFQLPTNATVWSDVPNPLDRWRSIVPSDAPTKSKGSLCLWTDQLQHLVAASPSHQIVFPAVIDWTVPVLIRDAVDENWFAVFYVRKSDNPHKPAIKPEWL